MNDVNIVKHMIDFVEEKEKEFLSNNLTGSQNRTDVVNSIIKALERELEDENK